MPKTILWLLLVAVVGFVGCNARSASPTQPPHPSVAAGEIGSRLPNFSLTDLEGHPVSSSELRGKVVLVDFWATWCQPCKKEMPGYQKLEDRYGPRGLAVIGFKFETMPDMQDPLQFAEGIGVRYPLAGATEDLKRKFGGIEGLPTTMLYDRNGILRWKIVGFVYTDTVESALKPLLSVGGNHHG